MKRILFIILLLIVIPNNIYAVPNSDSITAIENTIFGYDYRNESEVKRVERLEMHIYGDKRQGDVNKRLKDIKNDIGYINPEEKNIKKTPENNIKQAKQNNSEFLALKEDSTVEYPMVDKMEQSLFNTTYRNENIYNRLDRLEEKVFNKVSDQDLNSRVDKLAVVLMPSKKKSLDFYQKQDIDTYYSNSGLEQINPSTVPFQLAVLEQDILKNSYDSENTAMRLNRLEKKLFNRNFPNDNDITRLQRVMVAYDAKKNSIKYENNKKMQNMAAISQFGTILLMVLAILL